MVTVVDPVGTPSPIYNRSGVTIVPLNGGTSMSPTLIPHVSGHTIVLATFSSGNTKLELPAGVEVGDVIEIYLTTAFSGTLNHPSGESFFRNGGGDTSINGPCFIRKLTSTQWDLIKSA